MASISPPPPATYTTMVLDYCQLYGLDLPVYKPLYRMKDGAHHCRYTATFNGMRFRSPWSASANEACDGAAKSVFEFITSSGSTAVLSAAPPPSSSPTEQDAAARMALKRRHPNPKVQDFAFCKSILHEYAAKMHLEQPSYQTVQEGKGLVPVFVSTVHFAGVPYHTRVAGKTKKETEQLAARFVIRYILDHGNSDCFIVLSRIIQSKFKDRDVNSIYSESSSVLDSQVTSARGSLPKDVLKEQSTNEYLPYHPSKMRNLGISKQAPLHVSEERDLGIPKQAVDPGEAGS